MGTTFKTGSQVFMLHVWDLQTMSTAQDGGTHIRDIMASFYVQRKGSGDTSNIFIYGWCSSVHLNIHKHQIIFT